jgi:hypothetical protein
MSAARIAAAAASAARGRRGAGAAGALVLGGCQAGGDVTGAFWQAAPATHAEALGDSPVASAR